MAELTERGAGSQRVRLPAGALTCAGAALLALGVAAWARALWRADFSVPFRYAARDDTLLYPALIKGIAAHGWF